MQEPRLDPKKMALILIHMQNDVINTEAPPYNELTRRVREAGVIQNAARAAAGMRQAGIPVMHVKAGTRPELEEARTQLITDAALSGTWSPRGKRVMVEGTPGAEIVAELKPTPQDYVMVNYGGSAFYGTPLEIILRRLGLDTLVVGGVGTRMAVETTVRDATDRDFNVIVLSDCCTTLTQESHDYPIQKVFPLLARVRTTDQVLKLLSK